MSHVIDKLEFGGEINELYYTMIFYTADRLAEVDNKNYIQLRNNVLVWLTEKRKAHEVKGEEMYNR